MNILIAGIPRSGSLRLFNMVRVGLEQLFPKSEINFGYEEKFVDDPDKHFNILKVHNYSDEKKDWADVIFTTKRDLRDILASSIDFKLLNMKFLSEEAIKNFLGDVISKYDAWKQYTDLEVEYESFDENKKQVVQRVFNLLKLRVDVEEVLERLEFIKQNQGVKGKAAEYISPNHVSKKTNLSYDKRLDEETLETVQENFGDWLKFNGYVSR